MYESAITFVVVTDCTIGNDAVVVFEIRYAYSLLCGTYSVVRHFLDREE